MHETSIYGVDVLETLESTLTSLGVLGIGFGTGAYWNGAQLIQESCGTTTAFTGQSTCASLIGMTNTTTKYAVFAGMLLFIVGTIIHQYRGEDA